MRRYGSEAREERCGKEKNHNKDSEDEEIEDERNDMAIRE